jgi:hypothetical protein
MNQSDSRLLILECTPKRDRMQEGEILKKFLELTSLDYQKSAKLIRISSKKEFQEFIGKRRVLEQFQHVHIASHGSMEKQAFRLPYGFIGPHDLTNQCFKDMSLTFSACSLGRKKTAHDFICNTGARNIIAPMNEVMADDAALWYLNYYYLVLGRGHSPKTAHGKCNSLFQPNLKGGFKFFE